MIRLSLFLLMAFLAGVSAQPVSRVVKPSISHTYDHVVWFPDKRLIPTSRKSPCREEQLLLQIYLDDLNYGPGVLDGAMGRFSKKALAAYYQAIGKPDEKSPELALKYAYEYNNLPYVNVEVPSVSKKFINHKLPWKYSQIAEYDKALYRNYAEFMAERYHTSVKFLTLLNGKTTINNLTTGKRLVVPNVNPFLIEELESRRFNEEESINQNFAVVDTKDNVLTIFRRESGGAKVIAFFPITPGRKDQIRYGEWEVKNSITFPTWRYDPKVLKGTGRSQDSETIQVPPGPNNPVGIIWNGLSARSVGIHGTNNPDTIGRSESSGCIRMSNWDVVKLPNFLRPGCKVTIQ